MSIRQSDNILYSITNAINDSNDSNAINDSSDNNRNDITGTLRNIKL
jgi:hypothetical protein